MLRASFDHRGNGRMYLVPARANTQPALVGYLGDHAGAPTAPAGLFVLTMAGPKIHAVTCFHLDELYLRFGLPDHCPPGPGGPVCAVRESRPVRDIAAGASERAG
jgi:hypothetical protein